MSPALRVLSLAFVATIAHAQTESLPSIFAPRLERPPRSTLTPPPPRAPVSGRVRNLLVEQSERVLANAKPFELPVLGTTRSAPTSTTDGMTVYLPRFLVTEQALRDKDLIVRPPPIQLGKLEFEDLERPGDSRMIAAKAINLLRFGANKELNLNLLQMSGKGVDHQRDFFRAEIEFKLRF